MSPDEAVAVVAEADDEKGPCPCPCVWCVGVLGPPPPPACEEQQGVSGSAEVAMLLSLSSRGKTTRYISLRILGGGGQRGRA